MGFHILPPRKIGRFSSSPLPHRSLGEVPRRRREGNACAWSDAGLASLAASWSTSCPTGQWKSARSREGSRSQRWWRPSRGTAPLLKYHNGNQLHQGDWSYIDSYNDSYNGSYISGFRRTGAMTIKLFFPVTNHARNIGIWAQKSVDIPMWKSREFWVGY